MSIRRLFWNLAASPPVRMISILHSGGMAEQLRAVLEDIPVESMGPDDVFITNDPYRGGVHANDVMLCRPVFVDGAVRYLSCGQLPFDRELREFHASKMAERRRAEGLLENQNYLLVERDVLSIPREQYERWPLDAHLEPVPLEPLALTMNAN